MKSILALALVAAMVGGCAIVPLGYGGGHDGYYQERPDGHYQNRDYNRGDGHYQNRDYNRGDGNYRDYRYRRDDRIQGDPFWQRGS